MKKGGTIVHRLYPALVAALFAFAPASGIAQPAGSETARVGVLLPLTGNTAWAGRTNRIAADLAAEEVNASGLAGAHKIELVFADSACDPRTAHDQAQKLINQDKVNFLIGEWCSSASVAVAQVANDAKVPLLINISTADGIAKNGGPYSFQSIMENRHTQAREADLLFEHFKFATVAMIVENNDFGLTFRGNMKGYLERAGKKVILDLTQDRHDTNWYATITRIQAAKPDLVVVSIAAGQAANFVKQYAEAGVTIPLFSDYPPPPYIFERQVGPQAGKIRLVRGTFFLKGPNNTPAQKAFVAKFEPRVERTIGQKHNTTHWDIASYDAVRLVADAIKRGGLKPAGFLKAMAQTKIDLVLAHYEFDSDRGVKPEGVNFVFIRNKPDGTLEVVE